MGGGGGPLGTPLDIKQEENYSLKLCFKMLFIKFIISFILQLFDLLKSTRGTGVISRVEPVNGDVTLPNLGMSVEDRKMICEEVEIVYHGAATIRFDEPLRKAVLLNTRGTKYMIDLAKEMQKLQVNFTQNKLSLFIYHC